MGSMSASDAAPLPRLGEVFFDVRGSSRSMRLSWYSDTGVAVFSIWQGGTCTGTFRLPIDDLPRMVEALQRGPRGAALPADSRDLAAAPPRRALTGAATGPMPALASFPDYASGQDVPMTGEFRAMAADDGPPGIPTATAGAPGSYRDAEPGYGGDPLGPGGYPAYRDRVPEPLAAPSYPADRDSGAGSSFPGYADDGPPPSYRGAEAGPPPPSFQDDPLNAPYPGDPLGSGGYRQQQPRPGYRDPEPGYGEDPLGPGGYPAYRHRAPEPPAAPPGPASAPPGPPYPGRTAGAPPSYRDDPPGGFYRDEPAGGSRYPGGDRGLRHPDDPFQSTYPDDARNGSHPYGVPDRPEQRAPRGRS
jgi:hypothetical protein